MVKATRDKKNTVAVIKPTATAKWSMSEITPDHNDPGAVPAAGSSEGDKKGRGLLLKPATATTKIAGVIKTIAVPAEAQVECLVETKDVPDGTLVEISVCHAKTGKRVKLGKLKKLEVKAEKVIDPDTGKAPVLVFDAQQKLWEERKGLWKAPFFFFKVKIDFKKLKVESSKDYAGKPEDCLRIKYWHVCLAETGSLSGVLPECNTVNGLLNGVNSSSSVVQNFGTPNVTAAVYASWLRNTYVFHQASHGNVYNKKTNASIGSVTSTQPPDDVPDPSKWRSAVVITPPPRFCDARIKHKATVLSTPRHLYYASTCLTGWEDSFAKAMIRRGCRNVIAFRRTIPDAEAPILAQKLYTRWANTDKLDPAKIPDCFYRFAPDHETNMVPVLFGPGAKSDGLSAGEIALVTVGLLAGGALVGVAVYALLK